MSDVDKELDKKEDEELDLEDQEQEELQDDAEHQDDEQQEDDEQEEADEQDEEDDSDEDEEESPKPSRREQLRIQQLLQRMKDDGPAPQKRRKTQDNPFKEDDSQEEDTPNYRQEIEDFHRFSLFETRLEVDAPRVESKYPQLDKSSDEFDPVLADAINRMYLSFVGYNPQSRSVRTSDIRYAEFVEANFELAEQIAGRKLERTTTNLKKQVAKTGIRPGGGATKRLNLNKAPSEMTDEELDAVINQSFTPPKR